MFFIMFTKDTETSDWIFSSHALLKMQPKCQIVTQITEKVSLGKLREYSPDTYFPDDPNKSFSNLAAYQNQLGGGF